MSRIHASISHNRQLHISSSSLSSHLRTGFTATSQHCGCVRVCVCMWDLHYVLFGGCTLHRIAQKWNDTPDIKPARAHGDLPTWICIFHEPHHLSTVTLLNRTRSCMCVCVCSRVRAQTLRQQNPDVATGGRAAFVALTYTNLCDVHLKAGRIRR